MLRPTIIGVAKKYGWRVQEGNRSVVFTQDDDMVVTTWDTCPHNDFQWTKFVGAEVWSDRRHGFNAGTLDIVVVTGWLTSRPERASAGLRPKDQQDRPMIEGEEPLR